MKVLKSLGAMIIAFILLCGVAFGIGWGITGTYDITKWFNKKPIEGGQEGDSGNNGGGNNDNKPDDGTEPVEEYVGSVIVDVESEGVQLYSAVLPRAAYAANGVSEQADSAYTLTVEVLPDYATDKTVDWTVTWSDSVSEWATGKTVSDYVTVTPNSDGAATAVLTCLKDFGEPVKLLVRSRSNPEACGTCLVHYYQRVKSCDFKFHFDNQEVIPTVENGVYKIDYTGEQEDYTIELSPVYSNYTLSDTYTTTINGSLSSTFGYSATESLNVLKVPAGLAGGDPELSQNALNWCDYVSSTVFGHSTYNTEYISIGRELCLGNDVFAHAQNITPTYKLTDEEKMHPRCAYYISLISTDSNFINETTYNQTKNQFESYQPAAYNYYGAQISAYNDFVYAVKECNEANVGVIQFTIKIEGIRSSYETVLNISYNDDFKVNVTEIKMPDNEIAF